MKKICFIIFFCLQFLFQKAQIVFCPPHTVWTNVFTHSWPNQTLEYENVVYTGKQLLGGDTVKVLTHNRFFLQTNMSSTGITYIKQKGDTIFMKNARTQNNWQILYNYAATVGSSWKNDILGGFSFNPTLVSYTTNVLSIQTVTINGYQLKQLSVFVNQTGLMQPYGGYFNITERLGSSSFLFHFPGRAVSDGDRFVENLCYSDSIFGNYQIGAHSCNYLNTMGLEQTSAYQKNIYLYPNPVAGDLKINPEVLTDENYFYCICNLQGQIILNGELKTDQNCLSIPVACMAKGVYILSLRSADNQTTFTTRFVKTE